MNMEKIEARVGKVCQDLFARKESPESAKAKIMALVNFPALPPLKWQETRTHQSLLCPLTSERFTLAGLTDGTYGATVSPAHGLNSFVISDGKSREITIAAIEQHRNDNLKKKLGL